MRSFVTSYNGLFELRSSEAPAVERIEIPLIQRDYAQGRTSHTVRRIRDTFLGVLHQAVTTDASVSLDFVYGELEDGTLRPLDGQQRLTTLFLLHWYLAFRADRLDEANGWKQFSYATRPGARLFSQRLTECRPPAGLTTPSAWMTDQAWYLHTWRHDPTIQSMLVMLDAIHLRFLEDDCTAAWERLVDPDDPAISFHLLPMEQMGLSEDVYIKMNSRGKPLTSFENFKARFEKMLSVSCPERVDEFAVKVDGAWADILWPYAGEDHIVDDEFLSYFDFVTEVCEWRDGRVGSGSRDARAQRVFGPKNPKAAEHLDFFVRAFDTWLQVDINGVFEGIFAMAPAPLDSGETDQVVLYGPQGRLGVNLFSACCDQYRTGKGQSRSFGLADTIFLFAVILQRLSESTDFARRLRVVRNLIEASSNELRLGRMPGLISDVEKIVVAGDLDQVMAFNQAQVAEERSKIQLRATQPELERTLFQLEDHPILRGMVASFDLGAPEFEQRATVFHQLFSDPALRPALTGAFLAVGDYSRQLSPRFFQFGSGANVAPWRELLTGAPRKQVGNTREVLGRLLDQLAAADEPASEYLEALQATWLNETEQTTLFDWRYYFVKYPVMRDGNSGLYAGADGFLGYSVCMLNKQRMNSRYRDPYLSAVWITSEVDEAVERPRFTGYETHPRWMRLAKSGTAVRCVAAGFAVQPPEREEFKDAFARVCGEHGVGEDEVLTIQQQERDGQRVDMRDRIQIGAALLRDLVGAGL